MTPKPAGLREAFMTVNCDNGSDSSGRQWVGWEVGVCVLRGRGEEQGAKSDRK